MTQSILFIDTRVTDYQTLIAGFPVGSEVVLIDGGNGLQQMADALVGRSGIEAIHVFSHASAGALQLGDTLLSSANLNTYATQLASIGQSLTEQGDLLLYGCNVGAGAAGQSFVESIARMMQTDVAASNDLTGAADKGGDWVLEAQTGSIESALPVSDVTQQNFAGLLATAAFDFETQITVVNQNLQVTGSGTSAGVTLLVDGLGTFATSLNGRSGYAIITLYEEETRISFSLTNGTAFDGKSVWLLNQDSTYDAQYDEYRHDTLLLRFSTQANGMGTFLDVSLAYDSTYHSVDLTSFGNVTQLYLQEISAIGGSLLTVGFGLAIDDFDIALPAPTTPTITSAAYNALTNVLAVTGTNLTSGSAVDATKLTLTGEGGATYALTTTGVTASSATAFTITLNAADRINVEGLLNKDGLTAYVSTTTYNLEAASGWHTTGSTDVTNAITVSGVQKPTITSATYDGNTGVLEVTGSDLVKAPGVSNDITATKLTIQGEGGGTHVLTGNTSNVEITNSSSFTLTLGATDKAAVDALINKDGSSATTGMTYNLAAADDWNTVIFGSIQDLTLNGITASHTNKAPTVATPTAIALIDTPATDTFSDTTGTLNATDSVDGITSYGILDGISGGHTNIGVVTYDVSKGGTYGTLYVVSAGGDKGKYAYVPNANAINARTTNDTETFAVTATDDNTSPATGNATLTVNVTGGNDAPTNIALSPSSISIYSSINTTVGTLSVTDVDGGAPTYSIVSVNGNTTGAVFNLFNIDGGIVSAGSPSTTTPGTYAVVIRVNDGTTDFEKSIDVVFSDAMVVTTKINTQDDEATGGTYAAELADGDGLSLWEALALASAGNKTIGFAAGLANQTISLNNHVDVPIGTVLDTDTAGTVTIGTFPNNSNKTLTMLGGMTLHNGAGDLLTMNHVIAGTGGITKTGEGVVQLGTQYHSYVGSTTINGGTLKIGDSHTLPEGQLVVGTAGTFDLNGRGQAFTDLSGTGTITSSIANGSLGLNVPSGTTSTFNGTLSGSFGLSLSEAGTLQLGGSSSNTYSGNTSQSNGVLELNKTDGAIAVSGDLFVGDGSGTAASAVVKWLQNDQMAASNKLTLSGADALVNLNGFNQTVNQMELGGGEIRTGAGTLTLTDYLRDNVGDGSTQITGKLALAEGTHDFHIEVGAATGVDMEIAAVISGAGSISKANDGVLLLSGNNTYSGTTNVSTGTLLVNGAHSGTGSTTVRDGAVLGGIGSIAGAVTVNSGGTLDAGTTTTTEDIATGNLTINGTLKAQINGTSAGAATSGYDQIKVTGSVSLEGTLSVSGSHTPVTGNSFVLIDNDGTDAVTGTFADLAEGATVTVNGIVMSISYEGGTGNDVTLSMADATAPIFLSSATNTAGTKVILTYDSTLKATTAEASAFTVTVGGTANVVTAVVINGSTIELTLTTAVAYGQTVTVAYTDPTAGNDTNAIQDAAGNDAATRTSTSVTNSVSGGGGGGGDSGGGGVDPVTPVTPVTTDTDGVTDTTENAIPGLPPAGGGPAVAGDGNGDGVADSQQSGVTSVPFQNTTTAVTNPGTTAPIYISLVADSKDGKLDTTDNNTANLNNVKQLDAPANVPADIKMPLGLISFSSNIGAAGGTETFSLYLDPTLGVNAYFKKTAAGSWVNLASTEYGGKVVTEGGKTRLDFQLTDGGAFDSDGAADGTITDPGAPGISLVTPSTNTPPTLSGVPTTTQAVTTGVAAALADFIVADMEQGNTSLTVTLTPTNGSLGTITDANTSLAGIQLVGTSAAINTALAAATFTATAAGAASIGISVSDGVASPVTASYSLTATNPVVLKDADRDQFPDALEAANGLKVGVKDNDVFNNAKFFAMQLYRDILYREGETAGLQYWSNEIDTGHLTRPQVAIAFLDSPEFQGGTGAIARLYFGALGRLPDATGMTYWMQEQKSGTNIQKIATLFAASPEFTALNSGLSDSAFIQKQYQTILGRAATTEEQAQWSLQLTGGASRGTVLVGLTESAEYKAASDTKLSVALDYLGLLGRPAEQAGFDYWVNQQNTHVPEITVVGGFIASQEFYDRFLP